MLLATVSSNLEQQATAIATAVTGQPDVLNDPKLPISYWRGFRCRPIAALCCMAPPATLSQPAGAAGL